MKFVVAISLVVLLGASAIGQRPREVETGTASSQTTTTTSSAPVSVKAKYEGGVFGYNKKQDGVLEFDDINNRLVFRNKQRKELISIPYHSVNQAFADTQARRPTAATVVSAIPVPYGLNIPAAFIKKKYQYLTMQFFDDDSRVGGVTSFKLANKATVASVLNALAQKAGLSPKGEIFVRQRSSESTASSRNWPIDSAPDPTSRPAVFVENESLSNRVVSLPRPVYSDESRVSGTVRILVTVDERGRVEETEVVSGPSALQAAAVEAAKQAVFEPLIKDGHAVKAKTVIAYTFSSKS
ncbi:MAG TPA: TonB family protein [Pyrinomonadaceae bacterium]|nr:TonB family protein [Pyrinomonadaceae bacterium]